MNIKEKNELLEKITLQSNLIFDRLKLNDDTLYLIDDKDVMDQLDFNLYILNGVGYKNFTIDKDILINSIKEQNYKYQAQLEELDLEREKIEIMEVDYSGN